MDRAEQIAQAMLASTRGHAAVQLIQTRFRLQLVDAWGIEPGSSVLEIGCGQGDMTAVLADAVGPDGHVIAVDNADPGYGSPVTLGQSMDFLRATDLGQRIETRFQFDALGIANDFDDDAFDVVVLSQCTWYFASTAQVSDIVARITPWSPSLCVAEWDLQPTTAGQLPHLLAVLIQGQIEARGSRGDGNIRTPFSRPRMRQILADQAWEIATERTVDTSTLQDADWEVAAALDMVDDAQLMASLPPSARDLVDSQADVLRAVAKEAGNETLPTYAISANRKRAERPVA
jgi:hypothetical protein